MIVMESSRGNDLPVTFSKHRRDRRSGSLRLFYLSFAALSLLTLILEACSNALVSPAPPMPVTVNLSSTSTSTLRQGFVHGVTNYSGKTSTTDAGDAWITQTKPGTWRFSGLNGYGYGQDAYKYIVTDYRYPALYGTKTVFVLQDIFNSVHGKPVTVCSSGCDYATFTDLETAWGTMVNNMISIAQSTPYTFDYVDILAEPGQSFTGITFAQIYQLAYDAFTAIRTNLPSLKIIVPSLVSWNNAEMDQIIQDLITDNLHPDAMSWHELGDDPTVIADHVSQMRALYAKYPAICTPSCPEIHINEYEGENTTFIPGNAVGWLAAFEKAKVDVVSRACWGADSVVTYEECFLGFDGLLMPDAQTPQKLFWPYKWYADLGATRYAVSGDTSPIAVIAGPLSGGDYGLLVGNYGTQSQGVNITLSGYGSARSTVDVYREASSGNIPVAMTSVPLAKTFTPAASGGLLSLPTLQLDGGDVLWITSTP